MAKASLKLPDGTTVLVEGSPEEIKKIISLHRPEVEKSSKLTFEVGKPHGKTKYVLRKDEPPDIAKIVNALKESDEADLIESNILDRSSQVNRVLLPLYIIHKEFSGSLGLNSGEIAKVLSELGINIHQSNIATILPSTASKYVIGDKVRKRGRGGGVRYRLSRRGIQYLSSVINEKSK